MSRSRSSEGGPFLCIITKISSRYFRTIRALYARVLVGSCRRRFNGKSSNGKFFQIRKNCLEKSKVIIPVQIFSGNVRTNNVMNHTSHTFTDWWNWNFFLWQHEDFLSQTWLCLLPTPSIEKCDLSLNRILWMKSWLLSIMNRQKSRRRSWSCGRNCWTTILEYGKVKTVLLQIFVHSWIHIPRSCPMDRVKAREFSTITWRIKFSKSSSLGTWRGYKSTLP